jgi:hypothetical protein
MTRNGREALAAAISASLYSVMRARMSAMARRVLRVAYEVT